MRGLGLCALALGCAAGCTPEATPGDPRARTGSEGPATWRLVAEGAGRAAFLSRPGAAPDLVLWCRGDATLTARAHGPARPDAPADLALITAAGTVRFTNVRRQGGLNDPARALTEGMVRLDPGVIATLGGAQTGKLTIVREGNTSLYPDADPDQVLEGFLAACLAGPDTKKGGG
jgi:hypothetical protein